MLIKEQGIIGYEDKEIPNYINYYNDDGEVYKTELEMVIEKQPIYGEIEREATQSEIIQLQKEATKEKNSELTREEKLDLLLKNIPTESPVADDGSLPFKLGYKWEAAYNGNAFVWQLVQDPDAFGTAENPFYWQDDESIPKIDNAFYIINGVRHVYMSGQFIEF